MIKTAACLSVLLLALSCTLNKIDTQMTAEQAIAAIRLECTAEPSYTIQAEKTQNITFHVTSTTPWTITGHEDQSSWLSLTPASSSVSSLSEDIRVSVLSANEAKEDRVATLILSGENTSITHKIVVTQLKNSGIKIEFAEAGDAVIDRKGGEVLIGVNANADWALESSNPAFTVEKVSNSQIKVSAPYNNKFAARKTILTIKSTDPDHSSILSTKDVTQDINFAFEGDCTVQGDGSVKLASGGTSRVKTLDTYRYATVVLTMGDVHFTSVGQLCVECTDATDADGVTYELQCQLMYDKDDPKVRKDRLRTNGTSSDQSVKTYNSKSFTMTVEELNALKTYRAVFAPAAGNVDLAFFYNDEAEARATMTSPSCFSLGEDVVGHYLFGFELSPVENDDTWYVIKSCDITPFDE